MEFVMGIKENKTMSISEIAARKEELANNNVTMRGAVHTIRDMSEITFLVLRTFEGIVQCVVNTSVDEFTNQHIKEGATLEVYGEVHLEDRAPNGFEIVLHKVRVLSMPSYDTMMPLPIEKRKLNTSLETKLSLRPIALRNLRERAIFKIQEGIVRGFREFMYA